MKTMFMLYQIRAKLEVPDGDADVSKRKAPVSRRGFFI